MTNRLVTLLSMACAAALNGAVASLHAAPAPTLTLVHWNVENLFDVVDDPVNPGDDEYTPTGKARWTESLYRRKLANLAAVLGPQDADFITLAEIENRRVLEDLAAVLRKSYGRDYPHIIHREGGDKRGIDVAILSRFEPTAVNWLSPVEGQRDVLVADFVADGAPLTVIANHWKSWRGPRETCMNIRATEAGAVRQEVDRRLAANRRSAILVVGDFNDNCDGVAIKDGLRSLLDVGRVRNETDAGWLLNLDAFVAADARGTLYFGSGKVWNSFDSINVTRTMVDFENTNATWRVDPNAYQVLRPAEMVDPKGRPIPFRRSFKPGSKGAYTEGYADHFPIRTTLVLGQASAPAPAKP